MNNQNLPPLTPQGSYDNEPADRSDVGGQPGQVQNYSTGDTSTLVSAEELERGRVATYGNPPTYAPADRPNDAVSEKGR